MIWMPAQYVTPPSQKFTWPAAIVPDAGVTVAVNVTLVPYGTLDVALPLAVTASTVVVAVFACDADAGEMASRKISEENIVRPMRALIDRKDNRKCCSDARGHPAWEFMNSPI